MEIHSDSESTTLEELNALGFQNASEYQDHQRVMQDSRDLGARQKAASIAAGSTAFNRQEEPLRQPDPRPGDYFVTMRRDDGSYCPLLGPMPTHQEALDKVTIAQLYAGQLDSRAVWASFGTCRLEPGSHNQVVGLLNSHWPLEFVPGTQIVRSVGKVLSSQWNAQPGKGQEVGRIVAMSDSEVIQDAGRQRYVAWDRKALQDQALVIGEQVTITEKGVVQRHSLDKSQGLSR